MENLLKRLKLSKKNFFYTDNSNMFFFACVGAFFVFAVCFANGSAWFRICHTIYVSKPFFFRGAFDG